MNWQDGLYNQKLFTLVCLKSPGSFAWKYGALNSGYSAADV